MNVSADLHILFQCLVAIALGGVLGWEREKAGKWAGFRTHMLVCLASMLFIRTGQLIAFEWEEEAKPGTWMADPMRILEAIVTGVAFIGAGTVFRGGRDNGPRGLTTAATLLTVAPIGIAIALERYVLAIGITVLAFLILRVIGFIEWKLVSPKSGEPSEAAPRK